MINTRLFLHWVLPLLVSYIQGFKLYDISETWKYIVFRLCCKLISLFVEASLCWYFFSIIVLVQKSIFFIFILFFIFYSEARCKVPWCWCSDPKACSVSRVLCCAFLLWARYTPAVPHSSLRASLCKWVVGSVSLAYLSIYLLTYISIYLKLSDGDGYGNSLNFLDHI